jgi:hypothetical protein
MDTPNLRRLVQPEFVAVFKDGVHSMAGKTDRQIHDRVLGDVSNHLPWEC